mgnify:CR=1 FL=1
MDYMLTGGTMKSKISCAGHWPSIVSAAAATTPVFTAALNELGTYYRGASRYDESVQAFEEAGRDILSYGQKDTADYATNRINLAGTLRLQHQYDRALALYEEARHIYLRLEGRQSYHYAATLNNISLSISTRKTRPKPWPMPKKHWPSSTRCLTARKNRLFPLSTAVPLTISWASGKPPLRKPVRLWHATRKCRKKASITPMPSISRLSCI